MSLPATNLSVSKCSIFSAQRSSHSSRAWGVPASTQSGSIRARFRTESTSSGFRAAQLCATESLFCFNLKWREYAIIYPQDWEHRLAADVFAGPGAGGGLGISE